MNHENLIFFDRSQETSDGRRNICFDHEALEARKKFPPEDSAINMAEMIRINHAQLGPTIRSLFLYTNPMRKDILKSYIFLFIFWFL